MSQTETPEDQILAHNAPSVDPKVAELAERLQNKDDEESDPSDNELLDELDEDDFDMSGMRERRLEALKREMARVRDMRETDHGKLTEMSDQKEILKTTVKEPRCIVHFYHRNFRRCQIMDKHLELIAARHFGTRFLRVFVENVPWLVEKLEIKVLPCVTCFVGGILKDRLIGFEEIGNDDSFTTSALELRLSQCGAIGLDNKKSSDSSTMYGAANSKIRGKQDDDGDLDL